MGLALDGLFTGRHLRFAMIAFEGKRSLSKGIYFRAGVFEITWEATNQARFQMYVLFKPGSKAYGVVIRKVKIIGVIAGTA
jgi:hypothetical protein